MTKTTKKLLIEVKQERKGGAGAIGFKDPLSTTLPSGKMHRHYPRDRNERCDMWAIMVRGRKWGTCRYIAWCDIPGYLADPAGLVNPDDIAFTETWHVTAKVYWGKVKRCKTLEEGYRRLQHGTNCR